MNELSYAFSIVKNLAIMKNRLDKKDKVGEDNRIPKIIYRDAINMFRNDADGFIKNNSDDMKYYLDISPYFNKHKILKSR